MQVCGVLLDRGADIEAKEEVRGRKRRGERGQMHGVAMMWMLGWARCMSLVEGWGCSDVVYGGKAREALYGIGCLHVACECTCRNDVCGRVGGRVMGEACMCCEVGGREQRGQRLYLMQR